MQFGCFGTVEQVIMTSKSLRALLVSRSQPLASAGPEQNNPRTRYFLFYFINFLGGHFAALSRRSIYCSIRLICARLSVDVCPRAMQHQDSDSPGQSAGLISWTCNSIWCTTQPRMQLADDTTHTYWFPLPPPQLLSCPRLRQSGCHTSLGQQSPDRSTGAPCI
jgi:hypothetical protein